MIHKYKLKRTIFRNRMHFLLHGKIRFSDKVTNTKMSKTKMYSNFLTANYIFYRPHIKQTGISVGQKQQQQQVIQT